LASETPARLRVQQRAQAITIAARGWAGRTLRNIGATARRKGRLSFSGR
jgi:hypothetical protein